MESFEHREQDVAHFGSLRLTIERADEDKGAVSEAENKEHGPILESRQIKVGEAQIRASIQGDKLEEP